ncbi:MAG TPA: type II secretion system protein [Fimbriiglobus sp.]|jgi:prepilin-type N-terminal cleavage/methylation domain-containing protein
MVARRIRPRPAGFTLIELLVVITIIGVLAALVLAAVMKVQGIGYEAQAKSEIRQLETNINAYIAKNGTYLPSFGGGANGAFRLRPKYDGTLGPDTNSIEWQYLIRIFPALSPVNTGLPNVDYDNNQTMVFFLTGGEVTQYSGFSNDARFPFDTSPASQNNRKGKFFDIPNKSLQKLNGGTTGRYVDPWGTPYVYMAPIDGKQYPQPSASGDVIPQAVLQNMMGNPTPGQPTGMNPYRTQISPTVTKALKEGSFQIISAGPDKFFGPGGVYAPGQGVYFNKSEYPGFVAGDDFSNFSGARLSVPE